jgi:hypothetical protein
MRRPRVPLPATPRRTTAALAPMPLPTPCRRVALPVDHPPPPTLPRPLRRVPRHRRTPFSFASHFSPSPATWAHPSLSLLGLVSVSGDWTAPARTVFTPACHHFPPHGELNLRAPFSLGRVVPHFPLIRTLLQDLPEDIVVHRSTAVGENATARSTFPASPTLRRLGERHRFFCCLTQPPPLPCVFPIRHATPRPPARLHRPRRPGAPAGAVTVPGARKSCHA